MEFVGSYKIRGVEFETIAIYVDFIVDEIIVEVDGETAHVGFDRDEIIELLKVLTNAVR